MNKIVLFACILSLFSLFSCKTAKLGDAVTKEEKGEYYDAAQIYRKVYGKTSPKKKYLRGSISFHMGECYRKINNTQRALSGYQSALRYEYPDSMSVFYSAQQLHKLGRYPDAIKQYKAFLAIVPSYLPAQNGLIGCDSASQWKKNPTRYVVKKMDKFNSRDGEFSPMLVGEKSDQLLFASSRKDATGDKKSSITGSKNNDFFLVKQNEKKEWLKPEVIESDVNTEFDEGSPSFTVDGSTMYYTFCSEDPVYIRTAEVFKSSRSGAKWSKGQRVDIFKDSTTMAAHPAVSPDGKYLYFVSDLRGGIGGKDIWRILISEIGLTFPENLGSEINTPQDEEFPFAGKDSVLCFSSNGHPGMGGLDIFRAKESKSGKWTLENMKVPLNSMGDDFGMTFEGEKEKGYFSSNRNDGRGSDHIYAFELPVITKFVEGWVLDKEEELVEAASVRIVGKNGTNEKIMVRKDGSYRMEVKPGMEYVMMGSARGYLNQKQTLKIPDIEKSETYYVDFNLPSITKPVVIDNIFYAFNKATLEKESKKALDELIDMMNDNPNVTIELSAHTDRKGSDQYNQDLSLRRAQSVVDYLIKGGIEKERMTPAGYGKLQPKIVTKNITKKYNFLPDEQVLDEAFISTLTPQQQDVADQTNRRTEFKVLRTNYRLF